MKKFSIDRQTAFACTALLLIIALFAAMSLLADILAVQQN